MSKIIVAVIISSIFGYVFSDNNFPSCTLDPDSRCFDNSCGMHLYDDKIGEPCECTEDDIGEFFSACKSETQTRTLVYFWKPPAVCLNGTLPSPILNVPCSLVCDEGTYLDTNTMTCKSCNAGTYSAGGAQKFTEWHHFPGQFSTHCAKGGAGGSCNSWQLDGEMVDSGDNTRWDYLESVLDLKVNLVRPGYVKFQYRVSAEQGFDGLWFVIDDLGVLYRSNVNWTIYQRNLNPGYHQLSWKYYKDYSLSRGEDRAYIKMIEVTGTTYAKTDCEECLPGHYQPTPGQSECIPCPANYYQDQFGQTSCIPCPPNEYSYEGSTDCVINRLCNDTSDYTYYYSDCVNSRRQRIYTWISPAACDVGHSTLPPPVNESCVITPCRPGQVSNPLNPNQCDYCPPGTAPDASGVCATCAPGSASYPRLVYFDTWNGQWPQNTGNFSSGCSGNCLTESWRFGQWFTDSGVGHGRGASSWLQLDINVVNHATVYVNYSLPCQYGDLLQFWVDGNLINELECDGTCDNSFQVTSYRAHFEDPHILTKPVSLRWVFVKVTDVVPNHACDRAIISSIYVSGVNEGNAGAGQCSLCQPGTYNAQSGASLCRQCEPGSATSRSGSTSCDACASNSFADELGQVYCNSCGANTVSVDGGTRCGFDCSKLTFPHLDNFTRTYNLSLIGKFNATFLVPGANSTAREIDVMANFCSWSPNCIDDNGYYIHTYICLYDVNYEDAGWQDFGEVINIVPMDEEKGYVGLQLTLTTDRGCNTYVNLVCDTSTNFGNPTLDTPSYEIYNSSCSLNISWHSPSACPLCTEHDIDFGDSDCVNGKRQRTYYWRHPFCYGGVFLPAPEVEDCQSEVKITRITVVIIVVVVALVVGSAVAGMAFMWYRNKKLYAEYTKLKSSNVPLEEDANSNFKIGLDEDPK